MMIEATIRVRLKCDCLNNECLPVIDDDLILKPTGMTINSIITTNKR